MKRIIYFFFVTSVLIIGTDYVFPSEKYIFKWLVFILIEALWLIVIVGVKKRDDALMESVVAAGKIVVKRKEKGYELFQRIERYMKEKKPFLDERMSLSSTSTALFTNKVYVSKAINSYAGTNFNQYINAHRVEYSKAQMRRDPYLRMEEVAFMSGFHSVVTFNMAFRMTTGCTPTEWASRSIRGLS